MKKTYLTYLSYLSYFITWILVIGVTFSGCVPSSTKTISSSVSPDILEVHFIDVGQGDATLIKCGEHAMLIDAGDNTRGTAVQLYLIKQNISSLDAVIWTHPDEDHIGGADVITTKFDIQIAYMTDTAASTQTYHDLINAMKDKQLTRTIPQPGTAFSLGKSEVTFLSPITTSSDDNNSSIGCMIQFGNTRFLFTGDAEESAEIDMVHHTKDLTADVYKVAHHGSKSSSSSDFLEAVNPSYAVISCSFDNPYGHPHASVLNELREKHIQVFRTDEQGSIIATSDGKNITFNTAPSNSWKPGEPTGSCRDSNPQTLEKSDELPEKTTASSTKTPLDEATYIGNKRNLKLHNRKCHKLPQSQNQEFFDSLIDAKNAGYTEENQCKICMPFSD